MVFRLGTYFSYYPKMLQKLKNIFIWIYNTYFLMCGIVISFIWLFSPFEQGGKRHVGFFPSGFFPVTDHTYPGVINGLQPNTVPTQSTQTPTKHLAHGFWPKCQESLPDQKWVRFPLAPIPSTEAIFRLMLHLLPITYNYTLLFYHCIRIWAIHW